MQQTPLPYIRRGGKRRVGGAVTRCVVDDVTGGPSAHADVHIRFRRVGAARQAAVGIVGAENQAQRICVARLEHQVVEHQITIRIRRRIRLFHQHHGPHEGRTGRRGHRTQVKGLPVGGKLGNDVGEHRRRKIVGGAVLELDLDMDVGGSEVRHFAAAQAELVDTTGNRGAILIDATLGVGPAVNQQAVGAQLGGRAGAGHVVPITIAVQAVLESGIG